MFFIFSIVHIQDVHSNCFTFSHRSHLHKPVTKENWLAETKTDLFSHHTMRLESHVVDAFREGEGPGVLGRMLDVLESQGMAVGATSVNSRATIIDGSPTTGRLSDILSAEGVTKIFDRLFLKGNENQELRAFLEAIHTDASDNSGVFGNAWSQAFVDMWNSECTIPYSYAFGCMYAFENFVVI